MIQVGVVGAGGKMGRTICAALREATDLSLTAAIDPACVGEMIEGCVVIGSLDDHTGQALDVVIDFTVASVAKQTLDWCASHGVHAVVGTTGLSSAELDEFAAKFGHGANALVAPNFAIGAVLLMKTAQQLAPYFDTVEVIEFHHDTKKDAPSGTAVATVARIDDARESAGISSVDPTEREAVELTGARGARSRTGVAVHSVRSRGVIASEEVLFGAVGQVLTLRHDTFDRSSFAPGVLLAVRQVGAFPGLARSLEVYL